MASLQQILDGYKLHNYTLDQCRAMLEEKVKAAAGPVVIELRIPQLDKLIDLAAKDR